MTDEYFSGSGHPVAVDETGRSKKGETYDDEKHGYAIVICPRRAWNCKNPDVYVKDYAQHLRDYHRMEIDPVQERLMKQAAMIPPGIRKSKYVWAPFPNQIPAMLYDMHYWEMLWEGKEDKNKKK